MFFSIFFLLSISVSTNYNDSIHLIGDKFVVLYNFNNTDSLSPITPDFASIIKNIEITDYKWLDNQNLELTFQCFEAGDFVVPSFSFTFEDKDKILIVRTDELKIKIINMDDIDTTSALAELRYERLLEGHFNYIGVGIIVLLLLLLLFGILIYRRNRCK